MVNQEKQCHGCKMYVLRPKFLTHHAAVFFLTMARKRRGEGNRYSIFGVVHECKEVTHEDKLTACLICTDWRSDELNGFGDHLGD